MSQLQRGGFPPSAGTAPARRGSPRALRRGATSFRSGRKGLTAAPSRFHTPGRWGCRPPRTLARPAAQLSPTHAYTQRTQPPPATRARTHDRVGLHARSVPRRVSRHARRTRPRSARRGPPGSLWTGCLTPPARIRGGPVLGDSDTLQLSHDPPCHTNSIHLLHIGTNLP